MAQNQRILEPEVMMSVDEAFAFDKITLRYIATVHNGFTETVLNLSPAAGKFLDVGTGTGRIAIGVTRSDPQARIEAVDLSENMLAVARNNSAAAGVADRINYSIADAKNLPFETGTFDAAFCHNMLHHIPDPLPVLKEMNRVTKKGGAILVRDVIRVPDFWIPFYVNIFTLSFNRLVMREYEDSIRAAFTSEELAALLRESGIADARISKKFITHHEFVRAAVNRRADYVEVPTPLYMRPFKNMYVSKP